MTKNDLMQAYYIDREIQSWTEEEKKLKDDKQKIKIKKKISELQGKRQEIIDFIMGIDDPQTRLIVKLRCYNLLTWNAVADKIGGMNSEDTVKKRFYRFLKKAGA